ncbi:MAG TPA: hypothetical protein VEC92_02065 [Nitrososphaerales archaeon]|nr:hypothetical protein [Nitrososphaerales archaeon]
MKTAAIAATAILALLVAGVAATASAHQFEAPSAGQPNSLAAAASRGNNRQNGDNGRGDFRGPNNSLNLTVGQTLTLSGLTGRYRSATNSSIKGNASGTLAFKVTAAFKSGYLLAISSGTLTVGKVSYSVTGGTVELAPFTQAGTGSGTTSSSGQFLIQLSVHGTTSSPVGRAVLDLEAGGSEYLVTIGTPDSGGQGSH